MTSEKWTAPLPQDDALETYEQMKRVEYLKGAQRLRLLPGDVVVLKCEREVSAPAAKHIERWAEERFPDHQCIVLYPGFEIGVMGPEVDEAGLRRALVHVWEMVERGTSRPQIVERIAYALGVNERPEVDGEGE